VANNTAIPTATAITAIRPNISSESQRRRVEGATGVLANSVDGGPGGLFGAGGVGVSAIIVIPGFRQLSNFANLT
jgi:hypothetical protein